MYSLGIDLGTTFVAAALSRGQEPEMVPLEGASIAAPAAVYRDGDTFLTGDAALQRGAHRPDRLARAFKRRLGDPAPIMLAGVTASPASLLAAQLRDVLATVTTIEGQRPGRVVLSHPASWGPYRRGLFEEASSIAGLDQPSTIPEPVAVATHHAGTHGVRAGQTLAVYDLGGATFDAAVVRADGDDLHVVGSDGIERLGGIDFDDTILAAVNRASHGMLDDLAPDDPQTAVALARLRRDCVAAKEALSTVDETIVPVQLPGRPFEVTLTRSMFEDMIREAIRSTVDALHRALRSAHVDPDELSAILLVGGSSRIPLVAEMVSTEIGGPTLLGSHPTHPVALGAARSAAPGRSRPRDPHRPPGSAAVEPTPPAGSTPANDRLWIAICVVAAAVALVAACIAYAVLHRTEAGPSSTPLEPGGAPGPALVSTIVAGAM